MKDCSENISLSGIGFRMNTHLIPNLLGEAALVLRSGKPGRALEIVKEAKASQKAIKDLAEFIRRREDYLLRLLKGGIRIEGRAIKSWFSCRAS